jgi:hypothetical protein
MTLDNLLKKLPSWLLAFSVLVLLLSMTALAFGDFLADTFDVIGIRIAMLIVAFASFCSSSVFSLLIFTNNRMVSRINDDTNRRAERFREQSFASSNYSIIEFIDRMLIYDESPRYVERFVDTRRFDFHMLDVRVSRDKVLEDRNAFRFTSMKIPFRVIEGKVVSRIAIEKLIFERDGNHFVFEPCGKNNETEVFLLYNEQTKRNNVIINLITPAEPSFFLSDRINAFSKIVIHMSITSLLGVKVQGVSQLYFTNPEQVEALGSNTYRINSATFTLAAFPEVVYFLK